MLLDKKLQSVVLDLGIYGTIEELANICRQMEETFASSEYGKVAVMLDEILSKVEPNK